MSIETVTIKVKGINKKSKYPKFNSGSLLLDDETWINVAKKVDIETFDRDSAYEVEIETNDKGYKSLVKNLTIAEAKTPEKTEAPKPKYVDNSAGQREGAIGHYASRLTAAALFSGQITKDEAVSFFFKVKKEIEEKF